MKNFLFLGVIAAIAALAFAFAPAAVEQTSTPSTYVFNSNGTLTNAATNTIVVGGGDGTNFLSNFHGAVFINTVQTSGTTAIVLHVDEGFVSDNGTTYWVNSVDTLSVSGATTLRVEIGTLSGRKYRIRLVGSGTQSTAYRVQFHAKPQ